MGRPKGMRHLVIVALLLLFAVSAWAEVCPGSKVPKAEREQYDAQAALSPTEAELALKTHLTWGRPDSVLQDPPPGGREWGGHGGVDVLSLESSGGSPLPPGTAGAPGPRIDAEASDAFPAGHTVSIRDIETLTSLDLPPKLDMKALKKAVASDLRPSN